MVIIIFIFCISFYLPGQPSGQPQSDSCCDTKTVGGISYTLTGQMDTKAYNCMSDCVYQKEGEAGAKYCFAVGGMKVECKDKEETPHGWTDNPPAGGGSTPEQG